MDDINKFTGDNIGSIKSFQFIPVDDILTIPAAVNHIINQQITLKPGKAWFNAYVTEGTLNFKEEEKANEHGVFYLQTLSGFIPKDFKDLTVLFNEMDGFKYIINYVDNNGKKKIAGSLDSPLQFELKLDTSDATSGRNGHLITFFGESKHKAYFYNV